MINASIGIIGGVGPFAGLSLAKKVMEQTFALSDQEHLPMVLFSLPNMISDRTDFLLGINPINPAHAIYEIIRRMESMNISVAAIACNTAHAPDIFEVILEKMKTENCKIKLLNMVNEVISFVHENMPKRRNVGIISTRGVYQTEIYKKVLLTSGLNPVLVNDEIQSIVDSAIYNHNFGIKAYSSPVTDIARQYLLQAIEYLIELGAEAVILGCTEIPLAIRERSIHGVELIDTSLVLARAMIREVDTKKLKEPLSFGK